jgi:hypothetical protein
MRKIIPFSALFVALATGGYFALAQQGGGIQGGIVSLSSVTGTLGTGNGGTGLTSAADDNTLVGNGTIWQSKAVPNCTDTGGNHLNYTAATNAFSCGTSSGSSGAPADGTYLTVDDETGDLVNSRQLLAGTNVSFDDGVAGERTINVTAAAAATGTFEATWDATCTTAASQTWNYATVGNVVTLRMVDEMSCTADQVTFSSDAGVVPSAIRPPATVVFEGVAANDNSATITDRCVVMLITSAGTISVRKGGAGVINCNGIGGGGWTASNTRNLLNGSNSGAATFTYILN